MTQKEWQELNLPVPIQWSIYKNEEDIPDLDLPVGKPVPFQDLMKDFDSDAWDALDLDLDANVPDGTYDGVYGTQRLNGITVKNRQFEPLPTAVTIYKIVINSYAERGAIFPLDVKPRPFRYGDPIDHCFVEAIDFVPDEGYFTIHMGS